MAKLEFCPVRIVPRLLRVNTDGEASIVDRRVPLTLTESGRTKIDL
jgi:hypothetical protein